MSSTTPVPEAGTKFTESHYFRRPDALPERAGREHAGRVTVFKYAVGKKHDDNGEAIFGDGEEETSHTYTQNDTYESVIGNFQTFSRAGGTLEFINIAYFDTCDSDVANRFINAVQRQVEVDEQNIIPDVNTNQPDSLSLKNCGGFVTGLSIRAEFRSNERKALTLLLAMPYIGVINQDSQPSTKTQSLSIPHYASSGTSITPRPGNKDRLIRVHQAWFTLFDDTRLAVFKSGDDPNTPKHSPIHTYQPRTDAFQALTSLVSNILKPSEREPVHILRTGIKELLCQIASNSTNLRDPSAMTKDAIERAQSELKRDKEQLEFDTNMLCTLIEVIDEQIGILRNLMELWEGQLRLGAGGCEWGGCVRLPFMRIGGESSRSAAKATHGLIQERIAFRDELERWLRKLRTQGSESIQTEQIEIAQSSLKATIDQGQTVSVFTLITTVFLPLGFLATYFGLNPATWSGSIKSNADFWKRAAPITGILTLAMAIFLYVPDEFIKRQIKKLWDPFHDRCIKPILDYFSPPHANDSPASQPPTPTGTGPGSPQQPGNPR